MDKNKDGSNQPEDGELTLGSDRFGLEVLLKAGSGLD